MKRLFYRRAERVDPNALKQQAEAIRDKLTSETPKMNAIAEYLDHRRLQNGFGEDFEYTLRPKRRNS